ncbi:MAG: beta-N-acetylhexosaminidase [Ilumatobacteraceae bacterium]
MAALLTLRSAYQPGPPGHGVVTLQLENAGTDAIARFRLALTSTVQLDPDPASAVRLARRVSGYHEFAVDPDPVLRPGDVLTIAGLAAGHTLNHANDGPASAFVVLADGSTLDVQVPPTTRPPPELTPGSRRERGKSGVSSRARVGLVPWPAAIEWSGAGSAGAAPIAGAGLRSGSNAFGEVWLAVAGAERRLHPDGPWVLGDDRPDEGPGAAWSVTAVETAAAPGHYELTVDQSTAEVIVAAGDAAGFRHGFVTLAQLLRSGTPARVRIVDGPAYGWRGLHVDLARQFLPASDVARVIDLAAWRKLDRLHLHLTDDEAWRVPIEGYPALTDVGAWRGHGLPIPPLLGSKADPYGGSYTADEIRGWVERGAALGVVIVPEVDLPGHCHAALAAVPALRDPDDVTAAHSVQHFVDNSIYPGLPATTAFVEAVFGSLAAMFDSPWIHVGGDEVAPGAWTRSPVVAGYAKSRGLPGIGAVEGAFMADLVEAVKRITGRRIGVWQEAAEHGGVEPGDGYVVAWRSSADALTLASDGYDVVVSAPDAYYLDMALDDSWDSPGMSWAGSVGLDEVCAFEPGAGWPQAARRHLLGIQACVWTEYIRSPAAFDELVFPRLDAIAERAWLGRIEGGPTSIARRSGAMPRLAGR